MSIPNGGRPDARNWPIEATKTEFDLLELLMLERRHLFSSGRRASSTTASWGYDFETGSKSLDVYVGYLRRKTEEADVSCWSTRSAALWPNQPVGALRSDELAVAAVGVFAALGALAIGAANLTAWLSTSNELRVRSTTSWSSGATRSSSVDRAAPGPGGFGNGGPPGTPGTFAPDVVTQVLDEDGAIEQSLGQALPVDDADRAVAVGSDDARLSTVTVDGVELRVWPCTSEGAARCRSPG